MTRQAAEALRESPVAKAQRSPDALAKSATGRTADGAPVHSFHSLLADLATLARNTIVTAIAPNRPFTVLTRPDPHSAKGLRPPGNSHRLYPVAIPKSACREQDQCLTLRERKKLRLKGATATRLRLESRMSAPPPRCPARSTDRRAW